MERLKKLSTIGLSFLFALCLFWTPGISSADGPFLVPGSGFSGATEEPSPTGNPSNRGANKRIIARWSVVPYQTVDVDTHIGVVADHFNGVDRIEFSIDGGPWVATSDRRVNPQTNVLEYYVTLRVSDFSDGLHEIRAIAYPKNGFCRVLGGGITATSLYNTGHHSMLINTNRDGTLPSKTAYVSNNGDDSTADGTEAKPFKTLHKAAYFIGGNVFEGDAGGGRIFLKAGDYNLGTYSWPFVFKCPTRFLTIEPAPGVGQNEVRIVSSNQGGLNANGHVRFYNLTFAPNPGNSSIIKNINNVGIAWLDHCYFTSQANDTSTETWYVGWIGIYVTESSAFNVVGTPFSRVMARNVSIETVTDDSFKNVSVILNATVKDLGPHGTGYHPDVWQVWKEGGIVENIFVQNLTAMDSVAAQGIFLHGHTALFRDLAFRNVSIDTSNNGEGNDFVNLHMFRPTEHMLLRNSKLVGCGLYRTDSSYFSVDTMLMENVVEDDEETFCVPVPDHAHPASGPGYWPGTLPWHGVPLGVTYRACPQGDCTWANQFPVLSAGPDQTVSLTLNNAVLHGSVTDEGIPSGLSKSWSKISGPGSVVFGALDSPETSVSFSALGKYRLRFFSTDGSFTTSDDVQITVANNGQPIVDAGPNEAVSFPNTVSLAGQVSDEGLPNPPGVVEVVWSQIQGPAPAVFSDNNTLAAQVSFSALGVYVFRLTATDGELSGYDDVQITVNEPPSQFSSQQDGLTVCNDIRNEVDRKNPPICFNINQPSDVSLVVYSRRGEKVRTLEVDGSVAGSKRIVWDGKSDSGEKVSSGSYNLVLTIQGTTYTSRILILR